MNNKMKVKLVDGFVDFLKIEEKSENTIGKYVRDVRGFFDYMGRRENFIRQEKELSYEEYVRLIKATNSDNNKRLALVLQTIGSTGIRVSELHYVAVVIHR